MLSRLTPAEEKALRYDTAEALLGIITAIVAKYRLEPTEKGEELLRELMAIYSSYKATWGL